MVIKRNPKTGKYYVAPSPPSFYRSKPKGGSSGGGSSTGNNFLDLLEKAKQEGAAKMKIIAPDYIPPTSDRGISSRRTSSRDGESRPVSQQTKGNEVFIGGLGYSVAPELQKEFKRTIKDAPIIQQQPKMTAEQFQEMLRRQEQAQATPAQRRFRERITQQPKYDTRPLYQSGADKLVTSYQEERSKIAEKEMEDAVKHIQSDINKGVISIKRGEQSLVAVQKQIEKRYNAKVKTYADELQSRVKSPYFETRQTDTLKEGIPYLEIFYIDPETGKERKATAKERKEYQLGEFAIGEVQAKTYTQLQEEAGWIGKITTPLQRASITGAAITGLKPVKASVISYKETEKSASDWLYDVSGFTEERHLRQMADIEKSTEYLKDIGVPSFLAETGGAIARGTGKIAKGAIDKPIKTAAVYGTAAYTYPRLAVASLAVPGVIGFGLTKAGKGISKVDIFGMPVGATISSLLPKTSEELLTSMLFMKGAGKVISKAPKVVKRGVTRGMTAKGGYGLTFGETPEEKAMGLVEMGMGVGFEFGEYAGRRLRLHWDKNQVIKYSVEERAKFEAEKIKGIKYKMNPRPLKEQVKLRKYVREARELWKYKAETREIDFSGMERISQDARKPTFDWLKANKKSLVVGGTAGTRTQAIDPSKYTPHDIDIFTLRGSPEKYAKSLYQSLQKAGVKGYQLKGSKIYAPNGKDAVEFHNYDEFLKANIEQVAPWYQTSRYGLTKTPSGIKVLSMRSQMGQKTLGYARYGEPRLKDWLYVSKEARPTQLKAKAAYEEARLPDPFKFEPIVNFGIPKKRLPGKKADYETFDFGLDFKISPVKKPIRKPTTQKFKIIETTISQTKMLNANDILLEKNKVSRRIISSLKEKGFGIKKNIPIEDQIKIDTKLQVAVRSDLELANKITDYEYLRDLLMSRKRFNISPSDKMKVDIADKIVKKRVPIKEDFFGRRTSYEEFDFGLDLGVVKPLIKPTGKPTKTPYKKYQPFETFLYTPYKPTKKPPYRPYKRSYAPVLSLISPPYKPSKRPPYKPVGKRVTPLYKPVVRKIKPYRLYQKPIDPFKSLAVGFPLDREKPIKKVIKKKPYRKKKKGYVAVITGFEAALGLGPRYVKAGTKFTGFEAIRGRVAKKKVKRKDIKKKVAKKKRDELSGWLY